jgi:hypothetical protein
VQADSAVVGGVVVGHRGNIDASVAQRGEGRGWRAEMEVLGRRVASGRDRGFQVDHGQIRAGQPGRCLTEDGARVVGSRIAVRPVKWTSPANATVNSSESDRGVDVVTGARTGVLDAADVPSVRLVLPVAGDADRPALPLVQAQIDSPIAVRMPARLPTRPRCSSSTATSMPRQHREHCDPRRAHANQLIVWVCRTRRRQPATNSQQTLTRLVTKTG